MVLFIFDLAIGEIVKVYDSGTHTLLTGRVLHICAHGVVVATHGDQIVSIVPRVLMHRIAPFNCNEAAFLWDMARRNAAS